MFVVLVVTGVVVVGSVVVGVVVGVVVVVGVGTGTCHGIGNGIGSDVDNGACDSGDDGSVGKSKCRGSFLFLAFEVRVAVDVGGVVVEVGRWVTVVRSGFVCVHCAV